MISPQYWTRASAVLPIGLALLVMGMPTGQVVAEGAAPAVAADGSAGDPDLFSAWNARLPGLEPVASPAPAASPDAAVPASEPAPVTPAKAPAPLPSSLLVVMGGLAGALLMSLFYKRNPSFQPSEAPVTPPSTPVPPGDIALVTSAWLGELGAVMVVDILGERLVVSVQPQRDSTTVLTRLSDRRSVPSSDDLLAIARTHLYSVPVGRPDVLARLQGMPLPTMPVAPVAAAPVARAPSPVHVPPPVPAVVRAPVGPVPAGRSTSTDPDADLERLLDELLGKVKGLKPLAKRVDEI